MITAALVASILVAPSNPLIFKTVRTIPQFRLIAVASAPTGSLIAASLENNSVRLMDAATGQTRITLTGHPQPVYGLAFSPDGNILATADESARIWLWNAKNGQKLAEFPRLATGHTRGISSLSFSADGRMLASTGRDDMILLWNVAARKTVGKILGKGANVASATYSSTGGRLYSATLGEGVNIYQASNGSLAARLKDVSGQGIADLAINRAATRMVTAGRDGAAAVWDLTKRERLNSLRGHTDMVMRVALAPNGRVAATSSSDRTVILWDLSKFVKLATIPNQSGVGAPLAFTSDGRFLITASDSDALQIHALTPAQGVAAPIRRRR